jgi:predicted nucleic acid-binding protein
MILADTSVWIDHFAGRPSRSTSILARELAADNVAAGDLIIVEFLQGFRFPKQIREIEEMLSPIKQVTLCGPEIALRAAANYRVLRRAGVTVRGTIDVIIATWCIENRVPLLHNDRDFQVMEQRLGLVCWS